jgi:hypothetical protein
LRCWALPAHRTAACELGKLMGLKVIACASSDKRICQSAWRG